MEENSHGLKIGIVKIHRTVVSAYANSSVNKYSELNKLLSYNQVVNTKTKYKFVFVLFAIN